MKRTPVLAGALVAGDSIIHNGKVVTVKGIQPCGGVVNLTGSGDSGDVRVTISGYVMRISRANPGT